MYIRGTIFIMISSFFLHSCGNPQGKKKEELNSTSEMEQQYQPGSFGYDLKVLRDNHNIILLSDSMGKALVAISQEWQGRVMTSSLNGMDGLGMAWINHALIKSKEFKPHINPFGGEDRFWLGPEGGQFSLYHKQGNPMDLANWQVPDVIDTKPFDLVNHTNSKASFTKNLNVVNYSGYTFSLLVERDINLLNRNDVKKIIGLPVQDLEIVAFESVNKITNSGSSPWTRNTGALSIWILGMFKPSETLTIIIPYKKGDISVLGLVVNDSYFGKISPERMIVKDNVIFYKGDGKSRGKLGIGPKRATPFIGAYSSETKVLTIVNFTLPKNTFEYVNSLWEQQKNPFSGDVLNSYNDGPVQDGSQLGPFFELETSSPAAFLEPGKSIAHTHRTIHLTGSDAKIDEICRKVFNVTLEEVKTAF